MPRMSIRENDAGRLHNLLFVPELEEQEQDKKLALAIETITRIYGFEIEQNGLQLGMPPYLKFKDKDGVELWVAIDDYDGLSIDSNSRELLEKLKVELEKE